VRVALGGCAGSVVGVCSYHLAIFIIIFIFLVLNTPASLMKNAMLRQSQERPREGRVTDPIRPLERSAVYLNRIKNREDNRCWYCDKDGQKMARSYVLLHCSNAKIATARRSVGRSAAGEHPVSLSDPR
jgi:hypothetical protein